MHSLLTFYTASSISCVFLARNGHNTLLLSSGTILVMGGWDSNAGIGKNDVWKSTDSGVTWSAVSTAGWSGTIAYVSYC
jgi:hypothetical protein